MTMPVHCIAIQNTGLVTSVGLSSPASCAAMRARISNPTETRFADANGEWIRAHIVPLDEGWRGMIKLSKMAALALEECLAAVVREEWNNIPLLICVAEPERAGRNGALDEQLFQLIQSELRARFSPASATFAAGRVSIGHAMIAARKLIYEGMYPRVVIMAADSLVNWPTIDSYERDGRLLTDSNSNGLMPGEAAGAILLGRPNGGAELICSGIGLGVESSGIHSSEPLRADGLSVAVRTALGEAACKMHEIDFRISDLSGEQYYFKEAALLLSRLLRERKASCDIFHPAESVGETGAAIGPVVLALADAACRKGYSPGKNILVHCANDRGDRCALILHFKDGS